VRILVLEDDPARTKLFQRALIGHDAQFVTTAWEAIQRLQELGPWDAVFLDHDLGGQAYVPSDEPETGCAVARYLREHPERRPARILVHSLNESGRKLMLAMVPGSVGCPGVWMEPDQVTQLLTPPPREDDPAS
jgi:CheY-like chemotaxis protein